MQACHVKCTIYSNILIITLCINIIAYDRYQEIRELIIQMVLATDITKHFKLISEFKTKSATAGLSSSKKEDIQLVLVMVMKLADLGHTAKSCALHINWCNRITQEFFHQVYYINISTTYKYSCRYIFRAMKKNDWKFRSHRSWTENQRTCLNQKQGFWHI